MATRIRLSLPVTRHRRSVATPRLLAWLGAVMDMARQRYALAELDDRLLRDAGITRAEAREEARKPIWRGVRRE